MIALHNVYHMAKSQRLSFWYRVARGMYFVNYLLYHVNYLLQIKAGSIRIKWLLFWNNLKNSAKNTVTISLSTIIHNK